VSGAFVVSTKDPERITCQQITRTGDAESKILLAQSR